MILTIYTETNSREYKTTELFKSPLTVKAQASELNFSRKYNIICCFLFGAQIRHR